MVDISLDKSPPCNFYRFHPRDDQQIHLILSVASGKGHCLCIYDKGNCRESSADFGAKTDKCKSPVPLDLLRNSVFYGSRQNSQTNFYFAVQLFICSMQIKLPTITIFFCNDF